MAVKVFTIDMNGGDETSADTAIYFKIYGSADSYTTAIATTGVHGTTGVSVSAGTATVTWEVGTETAFKVTQVDEAGNESVASAVYDTATPTELYPTGNAASITGEANSIGPWTNDGVGFSTITSSTVQKSSGSYSILITQTATYGRGAFEFPVVSGNTYRVSFKTESNAAPNGFINAWVGFVTSPSVMTTDWLGAGVWESHSFDVVANITGNAKIRIYAGSPGSGTDYLYVDEMSITDITP